MECEYAGNFDVCDLGLRIMGFGKDNNGVLGWKLGVYWAQQKKWTSTFCVLAFGLEMDNKGVLGWKLGVFWAEKKGTSTSYVFGLRVTGFGRRNIDVLG